jgi:hypothetical protein
MHKAATAAAAANLAFIWYLLPKVLLVTPGKEPCTILSVLMVPVAVRLDDSFEDRSPPQKLAVEGRKFSGSLRPSPAS